MIHARPPGRASELKGETRLGVLVKGDSAGTE
jgi:hypothetical protein